MIGALISLVPQLAKLGGKFIQDKDKAAEYAFKTQEHVFRLMEKIITMQTVAWVDAVVKIMGALMMFGRPLGSAAMTAFGIYAQVKGIELDATTQALLLAAFPAWGGAREVHKSRKHKEKRWFGSSRDDD